MKFSVATVAFAAVCGVVAAVPTCPPTELMKLAPLANNANLPPCQKASGFSMLPPTGMPTPEQTKLMCATQACHALIKDVAALNPSDCILDLGSVTMNVKQLVDEFEPSCQALSPAPTPAVTPSTTPAPSTTVSPSSNPVPSTVTPVPSTGNPAC